MTTYIGTATSRVDGRAKVTGAAKYAGEFNTAGLAHDLLKLGDGVRLERLTIDRETAHFQQALSLRYAELVYYGLWFAPLREALDGFFNVAQQRVTGAVGLKLWKGTLNVTKRVSPFSLYPADLASFTMGRYNPKDAEGFINLFALPVTVRPKAKAESSKQ